MYSGIFSAPKLQFPGIVKPAALADLAQYPGLLVSGDQLTGKVVVYGTKYCIGQIVVTKVFSQEKIEVGDILQVVVRSGKVHFLVTLHDAARNYFRYFETVPQRRVGLVSLEKLSDYKPLVKRGSNTYFAFVLHHHVPSPL